MATKKRVIRKIPLKKQKQKVSSLKIILFSLTAVLSVFILFTAYEYRDGFLYYLGYKTNKNKDSLSEEERKVTDIHIYEVLNTHTDNAFGFDVSEYQSKIDWERTYNIDESFELSFVFIRATAGNNKVDRRFNENWKAAKERHLIRGAYHYYRPNENSIEQADNFIKTVRLQKGDLPPVLDIEKLPKSQSITNLKLGLRRWLERVEKHYKIKPIIYSGESYYTDFLKKEFSDYPFWIANYNFWKKEVHKDWQFWQFTEKGKVEGVNGMLDLNVFNGSVTQLHEKCIK